MNKLNCQQAEQSIQQLLDERAGQALPQALSDHLAHCPQCQSWQSLFHLPPLPQGDRVPLGFANRVIERHQWERRKQRWLRYGSMLALAACFLVGLFSLVELPMKNDHQALRKRETIQQERSRQLMTSLQLEYTSLQEHTSRLGVPSIEVPHQPFNNWELPGIEDPLSIGMPALRTISNTFQNTIEPLEAPAKAAYDKMKSVIDDPELRKLMSRLNGRAT